MSIRAAILFCCFAGAVWAQEPQSQTPDRGAQQNPDSAGVNKPDPAQEQPPSSGQQKTQNPTPPKTPHAKSPKNQSSDPTSTSALVATASSTEKLLDALDAAIRQPVNGGPRPNLNALLVREAQLQGDLKSNADPASISREATEMLVSIYTPPSNQAPAPANDDKTAPAVGNHINVVVILVIGIIVAFLSPLICVAGFWLAGKNSETALRKGLRDAGLL